MAPEDERTVGSTGRRVVVGVDGSEASLQALAFAAELVGALEHAELVVVHARYLPSHLLQDFETEDMYGDYIARMDRILVAGIAAALGSSPVPWRMVSRIGEAALVLGTVADEVRASFIVVGRRGVSTTRGLLLGSTSKRLVQRACLPILVVP
jgi:nucleotide-binding universal stress UspA family protein